MEVVGANRMFRGVTVPMDGRREVMHQMKTYRKVHDENDDKTDFTVFIIHGHSKDWEIVQRHIESELKFATIVSMTQPGGATINAKVREAIWHDADCAVGILSPDDHLADGTLNARPNVIYELGLATGFFDYRYWGDTRLDAVLMLKHESTLVPTDLYGVEYIAYGGALGEDIRVTFDAVDRGLNRIFKQISAYFS